MKIQIDVEELEEEFQNPENPNDRKWEFVVWINDNQFPAILGWRKTAEEALDAAIAKAKGCLITTTTTDFQI